MRLSDFTRLSKCINIFLLVLSANAVYSQVCHEDDWTALRALYLSTDGDNWNDTTDWTPYRDYATSAAYTADGGDCSTLAPYGVSFSGGRVITINLFNNNLSGIIPTQIGLLSELTSLNLTINNLTGTIPDEISDLSGLTVLSLGNGQLSGNIPLSIGNLANLSNLYLSHNNLEGMIPAGIGNLSNLLTLGMSNNLLEGTIPGSLGNLSNLVSLFLENNDLEGCFDPNLANLCGQLINYTFDNGNSFDATWDDFCNNGDGNCSPPPAPPCNEDDWTVLRALYLSTDGDNWSDTTDWTPYRDYVTSAAYNTSGGDCSNLAPYGVTFSGGRVTGVNLYDNQLDGTIPSEIGQLTELQILNLGSNSLSGLIPSGIGQLSDLTLLNLNDGSFPGSIPSEIGQLTNLHNLYLGNCGFTGAIPASFANLGNLVVIFLPHNDLTGFIPSFIGGFTNLISFTASNNNLEGPIPGELGNLSNLELLSISYNDLSGCFDPNLSNLCGQLTSLSAYIDNGNNFDASWDDFCAFGITSCCETDPPIIWLAEDITIDISAVDETYYSVSDASGYTVEYEDDIIRRYCADSYDIYREYTVTDDCGNISTAGHTIRVRDHSEPQILQQTGFLQGIETGDTVHLLDCIHPDITADLFDIEDNSGKYSLHYTVNTAELPGDPPFAMMRMYRYEIKVTDRCGNTTSLDFNLALYDINPPDIRNIPSGVVWDCNDYESAGDTGSPEILDICDYVAHENMEVIAIRDSKGDTVAITERWNASDPAGNKSRRDIVIHSCGEVLQDFSYIQATVVKEDDWRETLDRPLVTSSGSKIWPEGAIGTDSILFYLQAGPDTTGQSPDLQDSVYSDNLNGQKGTVLFGPLPAGIYSVRIKLPDSYAPEPGSPFDSLGRSVPLTVSGDITLDLGRIVLVKDTARTEATDSLNTSANITLVQTDEIDESTIRPQKESEWRIYPNPTSGYLKVIGPDHSSYTYVLSNSLGQVIKQGKVSRREDITLDNMPMGIYALQINDGTVVVKTEKIVLTPE